MFWCSLNAFLNSIRTFHVPAMGRSFNIRLPIQSTFSGYSCRHTLYLWRIGHSSVKESIQEPETETVFVKRVTFGVLSFAFGENLNMKGSADFHNRQVGIIQSTRLRNASPISKFSTMEDLGFCNYSKGEPRFRGLSFTNEYSSAGCVNLLSACFSWPAYRMSMLKKIYNFTIPSTTSVMETLFFVRS